MKPNDHILSYWHREPQDRPYRIYGIDFDNTLYVDGKIDDAFASKLKALQDRGNYLILYTSRVGQKLDEALRIAEEWGLTFDGVKGNKPYCDYYIDDLNLLKKDLMEADAGEAE